jgi:hypothetical protein
MHFIIFIEHFIQKNLNKKQLLSLELTGQNTASGGTHTTFLLEYFSTELVLSMLVKV